MLHNLCVTFHKMPFISRFLSFSAQLIHFS